MAGVGRGGGIAFWGKNIKEVLERMKKEPWVCKPWLPLPAPLGRVCYIETGWDGVGVGWVKAWVWGPATSVPRWAGGSKQRTMTAPSVPSFSVDQVRGVRS